MLVSMRREKHTMLMLVSLGDFFLAKRSKKRNTKPKKKEDRAESRFAVCSGVLLVKYFKSRFFIFLIHPLFEHSTVLELKYIQRKRAKTVCCIKHAHL